MTAEMQSALQRELEDAQDIADPERRRDAVQTVQSHMLAALIDCQKKTADRVKQIVEDATAEFSEKRAEYVEKQEGAKLQTTKAIYQLFIDVIDRFVDVLDGKEETE